MVPAGGPLSSEGAAALPTHVPANLGRSGHSTQTGLVPPFLPPKIISPPACPLSAPLLTALPGLACAVESSGKFQGCSTVSRACRVAAFSWPQNWLPPPGRACSAAEPWARVVCQSRASWAPPAGTSSCPHQPFPRATLCTWRHQCSSWWGAGPVGRVGVPHLGPRHSWSWAYPLPQVVRQPVPTPGWVWGKWVGCPVRSGVVLLWLESKESAGIERCDSFSQR